MILPDGNKTQSDIPFSVGARSGIESANRALLETLHNKISRPFTATDAASALALERGRAHRLLAYLAARGWLSRVKRGLYSLVPLGATSPSEWHVDPWIVASVVFAPCYIGGWSACEHWSLTEQVFRGVVVVTAQPARSQESIVQGTPFRVKHLAEPKLFGTRVVWRDQSKIQVSDPSRTLIDILDDPKLGGGIRHVADIVATYFASENRHDDLLLSYIERFGNRAIYKRLGYLIETLQIDAPEIVAVCVSSISAGISSLDPIRPAKGRIVNRWHLRINARIASAAAS